MEGEQHKSNGKDHDEVPPHMKNMVAWFDMELRKSFNEIRQSAGFYSNVDALPFTLQQQGRTYDGVTEILKATALNTKILNEINQKLTILCLLRMPGGDDVFKGIKVQVPTMQSQPGHNGSSKNTHPEGNPWEEKPDENGNEKDSSSEDEGAVG